MGIGKSLDGPARLMPALVAFKYANFRAIVFDRIRRASNQMRIAAAFYAMQRPNKFLLLDDEGTLLHGPPPSPTVRVMGLTKGAELGQRRCALRKNCAKR
jgi:hypothetical protein